MTTSPDPTTPRIVSIRTVVGERIEVEGGEWDTYTRYGPEAWTVRMGDSDEALYDCAWIEELYQQAKDMQKAVSTVAAALYLTKAEATLLVKWSAMIDSEWGIATAEDEIALIKKLEAFADIGMAAIDLYDGGR